MAKSQYFISYTYVVHESVTLSGPTPNDITLPLLRFGNTVFVPDDAPKNLMDFEFLEERMAKHLHAEGIPNAAQVKILNIQKMPE